MSHLFKYYYCLLVLCFSVLEVGAKMPPLPSWNEADKALLKKGEIIVGRSLLVSGVIVAVDPDADDDTNAVAEQEISLVPELPELSSEVAGSKAGILSDEVLEKYFKQKHSYGLVDPQRLLSMQERADLEYALNVHVADEGLPIRLFLFDTGQGVPSRFSPDKVFKELYEEEENESVMVYYFRGQPKQARFYLGGGNSEYLEGWELRELLYNATSSAREKSEFFAQLEGFIGQLSMGLFWVEQRLEELVVSPAKQSTNTQQDGASGGKVQQLVAYCMEAIGAYGSRLLWLTLGSVLLLLSLLVYRLKRRYRFPVMVGGSRLGGSVGGRSGGVLRYSDPRVPPSEQREQFNETFL